MAGRSHQFSIDTTASGASAQLAVHGDVDIATAPRLTAALEDLGERYAKVVIDLADVRFMDSAGLTALFLASRSADRAGFELGVTGAHGEVATVLEMTGLDVVLRLDPI
jgi:anti-sigma B factor antagonist